MVKILKNGEFKHAGKRAIIVVPEGISHDYEKFICEKYGNEICKTVEVLTFSRLCTRIFEKIGGFSNTYLNEAGRVLAIYKAINKNQENLKVFKAKKPEITTHILKIIDEFKVQAITEESLAKAYEQSSGKLKNKLYDLYSIYTSYNEITSKGCMDPRDEFQYLIDNFHKTDEYDDFLFHFAGFDIFSPKQYEFIDELMAKNIEIEILFEYFYDNKFVNETIDTTINKIKKISKNIEIISKKEDEFKFLPVSEYIYEEKTPNIILNDVFLHTSENISNECMNVASQIIELMQNNSDLSLDDICITARNFESYKNQLQVIFERLSIPLYISSKESVQNKYPIKFIFNAFDAINSNFKAEEVVKYLKNPVILEVDKVNELENYIKRWKIKYISAKTKFVSNPTFKMQKLTLPDEEKLEKLNDYKNVRLNEIYNLSNSFKLCKKGIDFTRVLFDFYESMKLPVKILNINNENLKIKQQFNQIWDILVDSLEQFTQIYGEDELNSQEFMKLYTNIVNSYNLATIPSTVTSIYASGFEETKKCKILFIMGANSTDLPLISAENPILTNNEKELLREMDFHLAEFGAGLNKFEHQMIFKTLLKPKQNLYISYSLVTKEQVKASEIYQKVSEIVPSENITTDDEINYKFFYKNQSTAIEAYAQMGKKDKITMLDNSLFKVISGKQNDNIRREFVDKVFPKTLSPTQINLYNSCRYSYFLKYALKLDDQEKIEFNNLHNGNFVHYILEKTIKKLLNEENTNFFEDENADAKNIQENIDNLSLEIKNSKKNKLSEDEIVEINVKIDFWNEKREVFEENLNKKFKKIRPIIVSYIDEYFNKYFNNNLSHNPKDIYDLNRIKQTVFLLVNNTVKELCLSEFKPKYCELATDDERLKFSIKIGDFEYFIKGKIDRIDSLESHDIIKIIDYKSGKTEFSPTKILAGIDMQMLIYALILQKSNFAKVVSVMYSHTVVPTLDFEPINLDKELDEQFKRTGVSMENTKEIDTNLEYLISADSKFRTKNTLSEEIYENMIEIVYEKLEITANSIKNGEVNINPYEEKDKNSCSYCKFKNICGFNPEYDTFRVLEKATIEDFKPKKEVD